MSSPHTMTNQVTKAAAVVKKRKRLTLVCTNCKKRKSRCDRQIPCSHCKSADIAGSCEYLSNQQTINGTKSPFGSEKLTSSEKGKDFNIFSSHSSAVNINDNFNETGSSIGRVYSNDSKLHLLSDLANLPSNNMLPTILHTNESDHYLNMIPFGQYSSYKRSSFLLYSIHSDVSMIHQDRYMKLLAAFRGIVVRRTVKYCKKNQIPDNKSSENINSPPVIDPNIRSNDFPENSEVSKYLPNSFDKMDVFEGIWNNSSTVIEKHQLIHKNLLENFGKARKTENKKILEDYPNLNDLMKNNIPDKVNFFENILPFFDQYIQKFVPVIECDFWTEEFILLYDRIENNSINTKESDHVVYCILLLISKISQIAIKFNFIKPSSVGPRPELSKSRKYLDEAILSMKMDDYISIITNLIFTNRILKKSTIYEVLNLILLRFYYWISPEDGDGQELEQSQILFSLIISHCKEVGITWNSLTIDSNHIKIHYQTRPRMIKRDKYISLCQKIWTYVLYWDRKLLFLTGAECNIGKSYALTEEISNKLGLIEFGLNDKTSWFSRMALIDKHLFELNNLIHDNIQKVNYYRVNGLIKTIELLIKSLEVRYEINDCTELNHEFDLMIKLFKIDFAYTQLSWFELQNDILQKNRIMDKLFLHTVELIAIAYEYFHGCNSKSNLNYSKFYLNKIYEIVMNKLVSVILPGLIIRLPESKTDNDEITDNSCPRNTLIKIYFGVATLYFNEFAYYYYRAFRKMFNAKINYKIFTNSSKNFEMILQFLIYKATNCNHDVIYETDTYLLSDLIPFIKDKKIINEIQFTINYNKLDYQGDLTYYKRVLKKIIDIPNFYSFNIFQTFYNNAKLFYACCKAGAPSLTETLNDNYPTNDTTDQSQNNNLTNSNGFENIDYTDLVLNENSTIQNEEMNMFITELFEPFDLISYI